MDNGGQGTAWGRSEVHEGGGNVAQQTQEHHVATQQTLVGMDRASSSTPLGWQHRGSDGTSLQISDQRIRGQCKTAGQATQDSTLKVACWGKGGP